MNLTWLLTKPAVLFGLFMCGVLAAFVLYFFYSHHEINILTQKLSVQTIQVQQNELTISALNNRLLLLQKLNDNFNNEVNIIKQKQTNAENELNLLKLSSQAITKPKEVETFINNRSNKIIDQLNSINSKINK